ncbi:lymphatic vessel endothelial hyaluronic acid receptor 1 [Centrocercus urophasianus]|uniref:lymphatic vessel endothelial hyaluronic acid receptor 1 n=1 Tax=Centrocercus urophasianus TaxID=9002 RepID=UPI001C64799F|nr:lymphatic vessel endothelial hyaluronic acid receptor 1 [Centrocercus urophasianus]
MTTFFGVTSAVLSVWIMTFMAQNYCITGSTLSPCRITGVGLYLDEKVNFSEASNVCSRLNLQLASKEQVEKALKNGFETCSSGWIKDGLVAIPRITSNKKCGRGSVGLVNWRANQASKFAVYCFNSSDVQINSCKPDPTTTILPSSVPTELTAYSGSDLTGNTTAVPTATEPEQTLKNVRFRIICITETILPTEGTTTTMPEEYHTYPAAFRNDGVVFGGIPTALLVLAVIFFIISVLLAVCYIKKYKKSFPFSNKNQKKMVETTTLKETASNDKTLEKETKNNEKKVEEAKAKPETTVKCLEVEV